MRIMCDKPGKLNLDVSTKSILRFNNIATGNDELTMKGKAPAHVDPSYHNKNPVPVIYDDTTGCNGMRFENDFESDK
jgi:alpha-L-fucosidase 2